MRKLLLLVLFPTTLFAAPFIVSDPDPTGSADVCIYQEGAQSPVSSAVVAIPPSTVVGSCRFDASVFSVGTHTLQVWFSSSVWGVTSTKVPFVFTRPSATATGPQNLKLVP